MGSSQAEAEREAARAEKPYEIWITADGRRTEREHSGLVECSVAHVFDNDSIVKVCIVYVYLQILQLHSH